MAKQATDELRVCVVDMAAIFPDYKIEPGEKWADFGKPPKYELELLPVERANELLGNLEKDLWHITIISSRPSRAEINLRMLLKSWQMLHPFNISQSNPALCRDIVMRSETEMDGSAASWKARRIAQLVSQADKAMYIGDSATGEALRQIVARCEWYETIEQVGGEFYAKATW